MLKTTTYSKKWSINFTCGVDYLLPLFKFKKFPSNEKIVFCKNT